MVSSFEQNCFQLKLKNKAEKDEDALFALEEAVRRHGAQLLCTSPEVHNPTTLCTPEWRRMEIIDVARRTGLQLVEDDCYRLGTPVGRPYRALLPEP